MNDRETFKAPADAVAYHGRRLACEGQPDDETVVAFSDCHNAQHGLRWAAERVASLNDMFLDFLDTPPREETTREPESIVTWLPNQNDHTAFGPTYRWGILRLRAIRPGWPLDRLPPPADEWFVDTVHGNDANTGRRGSPLKTSAELARRVALHPQGSTMPVSSPGPTVDDVNALHTDWRARAPDIQRKELLPVPDEHNLHFAVAQAKPGAMIEIAAITNNPDEPNPLSVWKVRSMLRLSEIDAARLGVILTMFADAEDCIAIREEILKGPEGTKILARSIRRQAAKNAAAQAMAPNEPPAVPAAPTSESATFTATGLTTAVGPRTKGVQR